MGELRVNVTELQADDAKILKSIKEMKNVDAAVVERLACLQFKDLVAAIAYLVIH
jgi:hypothetical protein